MSILPLPQFEADFEQARRDAEECARLSIPSTLVVRFGVMRLIGEFAYSGDARPGCGTKLVVRTHRGTELAEMLTSACPNGGCSNSLSRQEMLQYIENSGGQDYPLFSEGRILHVATVEDLNEQARLEALAPGMVRFARERAAYLNLPMKVVDAEPILGRERLTFYFTSEERIDFRDLVQELSHEYKTRIELRQVGARDEARLVADYEKCGQHCCCKQFLKVLKPVSIKSAKTQKATLDPLKISGRCGRLMCCLRYEDSTYEELVKRLPKLKKRVGTPKGPGIVVDRQILTQLVLVRLESDDTEIAVPVEEIIPPDQVPPPAPREAEPPRDMAAKAAGRRPPPDRAREMRERPRPEARPPAPTPSKPERPEAGRPPAGPPAAPASSGPGVSGGEPLDPARRKRRRRRKKKGGGGGGGPFQQGGSAFG